MRRFARPEFLVMYFVLALLSLTAVFSFQSWLEYQESTKEAARRRQTFEEAQSLVPTLQDAESGQRGYLLTGDEEYLRAYSDAIPRISKVLNKLQRLDDDAGLRAALKEAIAGKLAELAETIRLQKAGSSASALELVRSGQGKAEMDRIRLLASQFIQNEGERLSERNRRAQAQANRLGIVASAATSMLCCFLFFALVWMKGQGKRGQELSEISKSDADRAQADLEVSERHHRMLFENNPQPMWVFDVESLKFLDVNDAAVLHYGYSREEFLGMTLRELRPSQNDVDELLRDVAGHKTIRHTDGPWRHRKKDGTVIDVEITAVPIEFESRKAKIVSATDITARLAAQRALKRSEERYRAIVETASDAIITIDEESTVVFASAPIERIFGYAPAEVVGKKLTMLIPETLRESYTAALQKQLATKERDVAHKLIECSGLHRDGSEVPVEVSFGEFRDGAGLWFTGVIRDVTERRRTMESLRQANDLIQTLFHTVPLAIWGIDLEGKVTFWNHTAEGMFGWTQEEVIGKLLPVIPEEQMPEFREWLAGYAKGETLVAMERARQRKNGSEVECALWTAPLRSGRGDIAGTIAIVADISERKRYEKNLRESEEKFRKLFADNPQPMWVFELGSLRFMEVNQAAIEHYGYTREEFLSMTLADIRPPEDVPAFLSVVNAFGDTPTRGEWRHILKDGRTIHAEINAHKIDLYGQSAILSLVQDITERQRAAQELGRYVQQLARANADLQQFAYAASHDLLEPIRMITTHTQLFERNMGHSIPAEGREYLRYAREGAVRMRALVEALREYWEIQQRTLERKPVALAAVLHRALARVEAFVKANEAEVTWTELPTIHADQGLLLRLFIEIIENALKFRSDATPRVTISSTISDRYYTVAVRDNGIGMERQYSERVFQIFQRLSRDYAGVGIGLSLCKQIMERHDGRIWIDSQPGQGTTVSLQFPRL